MSSQISGWLSYLMVAAALPLLLAAASLVLLQLFPVALQVDAGGSGLSISLDGHTEAFPLAHPIRSVRFVPIDPLHREYQIDGSDTTNNFTYDPAYFSHLAATPYYRFQAFLRDEGGYSRWRNLVVKGPGSAVIVRESTPLENAPIPLPGQFRLSVQLERLETPRSVEFVEEDGEILTLEVNRNDRYARVTRAVAGGSPDELARWYYPTDWLPPAAEIGYLVLRSCALGLALVLLLVPLAAAMPFGRVWLPGRWLTARIVALAVVIVLAAGGYSALLLFDRAPHILDAVSYYFQGKTLAAGSLTAPAPPLKEAFPTPFMVVDGGKWFSQYPPGTAALLAAGFRVGMPWIVEPLLAASATLLVYKTARRQYWSTTALVALLLMASSPFLPLMAGSYLSHVPAMFFVSCFLYAATRYGELPAKRWAVLAGASLGATFLTREVAAVLYGLPVGLYVVVDSYRRHRSRIFLQVVLGLLTLLLWGAAYLWYNQALTGSPWEPPRLLFFGADRFGFGEGIGFYGQHTVAAGLVNADELLTSLNIYLFGWPFGFTLALILLPFLLWRAVAWDWVHGVVVALFAVVYVGYFYHGIVLGPRYYFEALPSLVLLSARGFSVLAEVVGAILGSMGRSRALPRAANATLLLGVALLACNLLYFEPRQAELYRGFTGMPTGKGPVLGDFVHPTLEGRVSRLEKALVVTDDWWIYSLFLAPMNSARLEGGTVFALATNAETREALRAAFPGRRLYELKELDGVLTVQ